MEAKAQYLLCRCKGNHAIWYTSQNPCLCRFDFSREDLERKGKDVKRQVKLGDISKIGTALDDGWVITFPQGTTTPFKPIRRGTAHIIKTYKPIVVPIVIDGFRRSFDKKGIFIKKRGILQSMEIKQPLKIDYENESIDAIVEKLQFAIEQHPSMMKVIPEKELKAYESENKKREWS